MSILFSVKGIFRTLCLAIDSIAFGLIDNLYNLINNIAKVELFKDQFDSLLRNFYVIIALFALFRLALLLINSIIDPDKLTDSNQGIVKVGSNVIIMFVLLVAMPIIYDNALKLQTSVVNNNYIPTLFGLDSYDSDNAGKQFEKIAFGSLVYPDETFYNQDTGEQTGDCDNKCAEAINGYYSFMDEPDKNIDWLYMEGKIGLTRKADVNGDREDVFVFHYTMIITLVVAVFILYILGSFAIDIAVRSIELGVLYLLSPLFIITYIDPNSSKSGPFKKWLSAFGKTYLSLFIKLAVLSLMFVLVGFLGSATDQIGEVGGGFTKLILFIAILIFAKKAPKLIGDLLGSENGGLGSLGIKDKLKGAVGGAAAMKAYDTLKGKGKDFAKRKLKNKKDRMLGSYGAASQVRDNFKDRLRKAKNDNDEEMYSKLKKDRAKALKAAKTAQKDQIKAQQQANEPLLFGNIRNAIAEGARMVNPDYQTRREKRQEQLDAEAQKSLRAAIDVGGVLDFSERDKIETDRKNAAKAAIYQSSGEITLDSNKERDKLISPATDKDWNKAIGFKDSKTMEIHKPTTEHEAYRNLGQNIVNQKGYELKGGRYVDEKGNVVKIAGQEIKSLEQLGNLSLSNEGRLKVKAKVAENIATEISDYNKNLKTISNCNEKISAAGANIQQIISSNDSAASAYNKVMEDQKYINQLRALSNNDSDNKEKYLEEISKFQNSDKYKTNIQTLYSFPDVAAAFDTIRSEQEIMNNCKDEVNKFEDKVAASADTPKYDDSGKPTGEVYNPYDTIIDGNKYNPVKNKNRLDAIQSSFEKDSSKANEKEKEAYKLAEEKTKPKAGSDK